MRWTSTLRRVAALVVGMLAAAGVAHAQASTTASRRFDIQAGIGFVGAKSDYEAATFRGGTFYLGADFTPHFGVELNIGQVGSPDNTKVYERSYELGARYYRIYGRFKPYFKLMVGRGVFNFPQDVANLAYNTASGALGTDIALLPYLNARAEYKYQDWFGFPPNGLNPQLVTIGVAYHFPGGLRRGRHW